MKICFFCYDASKYGGVLTVQHEIMDSLKAEYEISVVSLVDHIEKNLRGYDYFLRKFKSG